MVPARWYLTIALVLMEMNVFQALSHVLGLYANIAIAWMMAVVADLVVNKPLGLYLPYLVLSYGIFFMRQNTATSVPDELLDQMREAVGADLFRQIEIVEP